jgi:hypothetical protein
MARSHRASLIDHGPADRFDRRGRLYRFFVPRPIRAVNIRSEADTVAHTQYGRGRRTMLVVVNRGTGGASKCGVSHAIFGSSTV